MLAACLFSILTIRSNAQVFVCVTPSYKLYMIQRVPHCLMHQRHISQHLK